MGVHDDDATRPGTNELLLLCLTERMRNVWIGSITSISVSIILIIMESINSLRVSLTIKLTEILISI